MNFRLLIDQGINGNGAGVVSENELINEYRLIARDEFVQPAENISLESILSYIFFPFLIYFLFLNFFIFPLYLKSEFSDVDIGFC